MNFETLLTKKEEQVQDGKLKNRLRFEQEQLEYYNKLLPIYEKIEPSFSKRGIKVTISLCTNNDTDTEISFLGKRKMHSIRFSRHSNKFYDGWNVTGIMKTEEDLLLYIAKSLSE